MFRLSRRFLSPSAAGFKAAAAAATAGAAFVGGGPSRLAHSEAGEGSAAAPSASGKYVPQPIRCEDGTYVIPWATPSREEQLRRLKNEEFDVVVIGGGCVGSGVAWEAATRGLKVALVERDDFASGTSGRSTKLIHGGIRYLEAAVFNLDKEMLELVHEALSERAHLLNAAPYMAHPLPTIIPIYRWWEVPYMWFGAKAYDLIAGASKRKAVGGGSNGGSGVPASYYIDRDEALFQFPMLKADGLKGAVVYYDGMHNDTRMNLMIALTACQFGAAVGNYLETTAINHDQATGKANGVKVRDVLTGEQWDIKAKGVINATGCFGDAIRQMDDPKAPPLIVGASGTHVILPDHFSPDNMGLIIPKTRDGRVLFFLPWEGMTICGTTDSPSEITMSPAPTEEDVRFIIEESNRYLSRKITLADVRAAWSGIRPLIKDPAKLASGSSTAQLSRKHVVETSPSTEMVSVLGGKWTTYRKMAEDAVDALAQKKGFQVEPSKTLSMQLLGADRAGIVFNKRYDRIPVTLRETYGLDKDVARHLSRNYGTRALQVGQLVQADREARQDYESAKAAATASSSSSWSGSKKTPSPVGFNPALPPLGSRLASRHPVLVAEVVFAVEQEYAETVVDILARRTRLAFLDSNAAREAVPTVVAVMASLLHWDAARQAKETAAAHKFLDTMITPSTEALIKSNNAANHHSNLQAIAQAKPAPPPSVQKPAATLA